MNPVMQWMKAAATLVSSTASLVTDEITQGMASLAATFASDLRDPLLDRESLTEFRYSTSDTRHKIWQPSDEKLRPPSNFSRHLVANTESSIPIRVDTSAYQIRRAELEAEYQALLQKLPEQAFEELSSFAWLHQMGSNRSRLALLKSEEEQVLALATMIPNHDYSVHKDYERLPKLLQAIVEPFRSDPLVKVRLLSNSATEPLQIFLFRDIPGLELGEGPRGNSSGGSKALKAIKTHSSGLSVSLASGFGVYLILHTSMKPLGIPEDYAAPYMLGMPAGLLLLGKGLGMVDKPLEVLVEGLPIFMLTQVTTSVGLDWLSQRSFLKDTSLGALLSMQSPVNGIIGMGSGIVVNHVLSSAAPKVVARITPLAILIAALLLADTIVTGIRCSETVAGGWNDISRSLGSDYRWSAHNPVSSNARRAVLEKHWAAWSLASLFPMASRQFLSAFHDKPVHSASGTVDHGDANNNDWSFSKILAGLLPDVSEHYFRYLHGNEMIDDQINSEKQKGYREAEAAVLRQGMMLLSLALSEPAPLTLENYIKRLRSYYERPDNQLLLRDFSLIKLHGDFESNRSGPVADFYLALHYNKDGRTLSIDKYQLLRVLHRIAQKELSMAIQSKDELLDLYDLRDFVSNKPSPDKIEDFFATASPEARFFIFGAATQDLALSQRDVEFHDAPYVQLSTFIDGLSKLIPALEAAFPKQSSQALGTASSAH